jgi:NAD(P)H-hydrate epimerase
MKYLSVKEMVAIEKAADDSGHTYAAMMEAAGKGLAEVVERRYSNQEEKTILALVGSGNNGGDALVALNYLREWGWKTAAALFRPREAGDILIERFVKGGGELFDCCEIENNCAQLRDWLEKTSIVLDGVLGTGIRLPIRQPLEELLELTNGFLKTATDRPVVVAVDCPSGVDCDSGEVSPVCIQADLTVTMAAIKQGLLKFPAYEFVRELEVVGIGLPPDLPELSGIKREVIDQDWVRSILPDRPLDGHKGTFGTSLIIAGSQSYPGAATLAGISAYRIGVGLVTMAVPEPIYCGLVERFPEATWVVLDDSEGSIAESGVMQIEDALEKPTACLIGPGLGLTEEVSRFVEKIIGLKNIPPLIIDADGLRALSRLENWSSKLPPGSVLTPHPGEMSALCGWSIEKIQADRVHTAERFARELNQILLLKGAHTVIAEPGGQTRILVGATPALAKAGSGDVLAGIICGLIAQGLSPFDAAAAGAWIHLHAGKMAASQASSPRAILAGEISDCIGKIAAELS